jgi:hypothetical protein
MSFAPSSPVTGGPQTGFTSPTYTIGADTPPDANAKQYAVTALGGTQAGVIVHSVAAPFTLTMWRPKVFKNLAPVNPVTGILRAVPSNVFKVITRKGVLPLAGQAYKNLVVTTTLEIPSGSDIADAANVKAALSLHFGAVWAQSSGIGDTVLTGIL